MGHWYNSKGEAAHTVIAKNGLPRDTTLADARKSNLLPSVTTVIKQTLAAPELERWKITQAIHSALTLPVIPGESMEARVRRVRDDSEAQAREAARQGSAIHDAFCRCLHGQYVADEYVQYVHELQRQIDTSFGLIGFGPVKTVWSEKCLVGDGYAGTADWLIETANGLAVVDFKGQDVRNGTPADRQSYWIQLAAYAAAIDGVEYVATIVFDRKTGAMYPEFRALEEIANETAIWWNLLDTWQRVKKYKPKMENVK